MSQSTVQAATGAVVIEVRTQAMPIVVTLTLPHNEAVELRMMLQAEYDSAAEDGPTRILKELAHQLGNHC
jgi:hypothetical protein